MKPEEQKEHRQEVNRQIAHLVTGLIIVFLVYINVLTALIIFPILVAGIVIALASKRLRIPGIWWFFKKFERPQDLKALPGRGVLFLLLGVLLSLWFFPKDIALAAITILALADSIAPLVGMYHGKVRHPFSSKRYTEGFIAGLAVSFVGAMFFVSWPEALIASTIAMIIEGIDLEFSINPTDDNLLIPLIAGFAIMLIRLI